MSWKATRMFHVKHRDSDASRNQSPNPASADSNKGAAAAGGSAREQQITSLTPDNHGGELQVDGMRPENLVEVFGERAPLAERYAQWLETAGIQRGLIGPREVPRIWDRHIMNSAVLEEIIEDGERVIDVGSGAGLPGIPLAIARPNVKVQLLEPLLRRTKFLEEVVEDLGLDNVEVHRGRAEEKAIVRKLAGADVVTSRAVAPLGRLCQWSLPLARVGGQMRALKGSSVAEELERDKAQIDKVGGGKRSVVELGKGVLEESTFAVIVEKAR
ncbi:glucose-inhibited division protein B [Corynebacterium urealyticum DSM 7111]|nr:glucose-inhibited division protein B [Corynebacterium urealyticum DSM 7111]QQB07480.1 16S rRNA (guanine(527)-N(7))-methyltransferase RsmG [Corynebacterium urealyticum]